MHIFIVLTLKLILHVLEMQCFIPLSSTFETDANDIICRNTQIKHRGQVEYHNNAWNMDENIVWTHIARGGVSVMTP